LYQSKLCLSTFDRKNRRYYNGKRYLKHKYVFSLIIKSCKTSYEKTASGVENIEKIIKNKRYNSSKILNYFEKISKDNGIIVETSIIIINSKKKKCNNSRIEKKNK
jgi:hypothetical protein